MPPMKLTILGAGAMGCLIGGLLQRAGHEVSFVARGNQLAALRKDGLTLESGSERWNAKVTATDDAASLGTQDAVLITTKAYQLPAVAPMVAPLLGTETMIVPIVNGLPWWYFSRHGGPFEGRQLRSLDPDGTLAKLLPAERILGCVNYLAGTVAAPGHVRYVAEFDGRLPIGELDGRITPRLERLGEVFAGIGVGRNLTEHIRQKIWHKLWGNIAFNPMSALTGATQDQIAEAYFDAGGDADIDLVSAIMNEARFIADKLGIAFDQTTKSRIEMAAKMRGHKTSMLVDIEQGRPTEVEAIVGVVREIGVWLEVPTPHLNCIYTLVRMKEQFAYANKAAGSGQR